jgi:hypothetical protein
MPEWLTPFPKVQAASEGNYTALAPAAEVVAHYQKEMRDAGIAFKVQGDGIGVSIVATQGRESAVVRIREDGSRSNVKVTYAVKAESTTAASAAAATPTATPAAIGQVELAGAPPVVPQSALTRPIPGYAKGQRAPLTPWTRTAYVWILESSAPPGAPTKFTMGYYEAPSEASVQGALPLSGGATIVDVFPNDCVFSMQDQAGRTLTFKNAKEAVGQSIAAGAWSIHPIKCQGIQAYLR